MEVLVDVEIKQMDEQIIKEDCPHCGVELENSLSEFSFGEEPHVCPHCKGIYYCVENRPFKQITILALSTTPLKKSTPEMYVNTEIIDDPDQ